MKNSQLVLMLSLMFLPVSIWAATVVVEVDTGTESINALEGTLELPAGVVLEKIYTGNSAILVWITEPQITTGSNVVNFAGFTPGGFRGQYPLFSISGQFSSLELRQALFSKVMAIRNDDTGTYVPVKLTIDISEAASDLESPEIFKPIISTSPDLFSGKPFISFLAHDKGLGIDRYEVSSTWFFRPGDNDWVEAKSPFVLSTVQKFQKIHVRAMDETDNFRAVSTAGPYYYASLFIGTIILLCVLMFLKRFVPLHF